MGWFGLLSGQERVIAEAVARGATNRDVAEDLHLSVRTIEAHLGRIYRKLGVSSRSQLVAMAFDQQPSLSRSDLPATHYAKSRDLSIAYQVIGDGPVDIVLVPGLASHIEMLWEQPQWRRFAGRISRLGRFMVFDKRGTGLSDPMVPGVLPTLEQRMDDVTAVMDAAGSRKALVIGISEGGPMSLYFAAAHPDRVAALLLYGTTLPCGPADRPSAEELAAVEAAHGTGAIAAPLWPSMARTPEGLRWLGRFERHAASPAMLRSIYQSAVVLDPGSIVPAVRVPVTVVHGRQDPAVPFELGERMMRYIAHGKFVPIDVVDHVPWGEVDLEPIIRELESLIANGHWTDEKSSVLAAILAVAGAPARCRADIEHWMTAMGARVYRTDDAAIVGSFAGPSTAVTCATMLQGLGERLDIGIALGEITVQADRVDGPAVADALRIAGVAAGETLVSTAVAQMAHDATRRLHSRRGVYRVDGVRTN